MQQLYRSTPRHTFFSNFPLPIIFPPPEQNHPHEFSNFIPFYTYNPKPTSPSPPKTTTTPLTITHQKPPLINPDHLKVIPNSHSIITIPGISAIYPQNIIYHQHPPLKHPPFLPIPHLPDLN
ncbi:type IV secretory system conjugative DNA transfer family protein, partial [Neisseria sicca]|uniref:type IV secretory system conjugative DNA transfer family protein n=1 Tax=Neisseria sicca TaxID=490 RepID=UPI0034D96F75